MRTTLACALVLVPAIAAADGTRFGAGVELGLTQASKDADTNDSNHTLGLYGRVNMTQRLSGQLEIRKLETDDDATSIRVYSALLMVDLANGGHWMPMLVTGIGLDRLSTTYGVSTDAHHIEGGFGLEYRADGGFVAGIDLRLGGRTIDSDTQIIAQGGVGGGQVRLAPASHLSDSEYRSARLYVGVHF